MLSLSVMRVTTVTMFKVNFPLYESSLSNIYYNFESLLKTKEVNVFGMQLEYASELTRLTGQNGYTLIGHFNPLV